MTDDATPNNQKVSDWVTGNLTTNNQCQCLECVAWRHTRAADRRGAPLDADVLTPNNSNQPHGQESLAGEQVTPVTPFSTTTGSTTLLPDPQDIPVEIDQNHQSRIGYTDSFGERIDSADLSGYVHKVDGTAEIRSRRELTSSELDEIARRSSAALQASFRQTGREMHEHQEILAADLMNRSFDPHKILKDQQAAEKDPVIAGFVADELPIQAEKGGAPRKKSMADWGKEKEAVRHSQDMHIKDFNTPAERVVPPPDKNYLDIVFDGPPDNVCGRFVEVEDSEGKSVSVGTWVEYGECNPGFWALRIPDHRHLQAELDKYRGYQEQYLTLTRKTQKDLETVTELLNEWKVDFIDSLTTLKKERDTANTMVKDLTEQYTELRDEYVKVKAQKDALITQDINHILASNQSLLEANRMLRKELHAARSEAVVERQNPHAASGGDPVLRKLNEEFISRAPGTVEGFARAVEEGKAVRIELRNNGPYPDNLYEVPESGNLADLKELQEKGEK
jgi:hypothetical protein